MKQLTLLSKQYLIENKWIQWFWGWILPILILCIMWVKLEEKTAWVDSLSTMPIDHWFWWSLLLLPLNVLTESLKWKVLVDRFDHISLKKATEVVLAGRSLNALMPFGSGDALLKYIDLSPDKRPNSVGAILLSRGSQMIPTLVFGMAAVLYLLVNGINQYQSLFYYATALLLIVLVIAAFISKYSFLKKIEQYLIEFRKLQFNGYFKIIGLSFIRYGVFSLQFLLLLLWLGWDHDLQLALYGIFWVFLIKSVIPNLSIVTDLVSREVSAVAFFGLFLTDVNSVIFAGFVIWVINIVVPIILGLFYLPNLKRKLI